MLSFYDVLGVGPQAQLPEIRAAYLGAALRHHPDKAVPRLLEEEGAVGRPVSFAGQRFEHVQTAWEVSAQLLVNSLYTLSIGSWQP